MLPREIRIIIRIMIRKIPRLPKIAEGSGSPPCGRLLRMENRKIPYPTKRSSNEIRGDRAKKACQNLLCNMAGGFYKDIE
jgi:hypothetical protein